MQLKRAGTQPSSKGAAEYFSGSARGRQRTRSLSVRDTARAEPSDWSCPGRDLSQHKHHQHDPTEPAGALQNFS
jgi:hypothetical protein